MPIDTHVLMKGQWFSDGPSKTLKIGDGVTPIKDLVNLWQSGSLPPKDDTMYGIMNGEYAAVLPFGVYNGSDEYEDY